MSCRNASLHATCRAKNRHAPVPRAGVFGDACSEAPGVEASCSLFPFRPDPASRKVAGDDSGQRHFGAYRGHGEGLVVQWDQLAARGVVTRVLDVHDHWIVQRPCFGLRQRPVSSHFFSVGILGLGLANFSISV